jgi:hypothetical protein
MLKINNNEIIKQVIALSNKSELMQLILYLNNAPGLTTSIRTISETLYDEIDNLDDKKIISILTKIRDSLNINKKSDQKAIEKINNYLDL